MTTIKVVIRVETDSDFILGFPTFIKGLKKIKKNEDYYIELEFDEKSAKKDLVTFLKGVDIKSSKEWHKETLSKGIIKYEDYMNQHGLTSSYNDLLGGGNWSFSVEVIKITQEYL